MTSRGRSFQRAEGEGFEPSGPGLPVQRFSRPSHSTALPPLHGRGQLGRGLPRPGSTLPSHLGRGGRVAEGTRLLSEYGAYTPSRVRIPPSPLSRGGWPSKPMREISTVGHSTHELSEFVAPLSGRGSGDSRRTAFPGLEASPPFRQRGARRDPAQSADHLPTAPRAGRPPSPRPDSPHTAWRNDASPGYADHLRSHECAIGTSQLEDLAEAGRTGIMCAVAVWWRCHRRLVADVLVLRGWCAHHVWPDGRLVGHELSLTDRPARRGCLPIYLPYPARSACGLGPRAGCGPPVE